MPTRTEAPLSPAERRRQVASILARGVYKIDRFSRSLADFMRMMSQTHNCLRPSRVASKGPPLLPCPSSRSSPAVVAASGYQHPPCGSD